MTQETSGYERWLPELVDFMRIRSVGADPGEAESMEEAAAWLTTRLAAIGAAPEVVRAGHERVVVARIAAQQSPQTAPTIVIYGHFDVQPPGDPALWDTPPWEASIRDGWLYGRGSIDTKGHLLMYLEALRAIIAQGTLAVNVRLVIDGAEESGGELALDIIRRDHDDISGALIFDGPMIAKGRPAFYSAARGMLDFRIVVRTGTRDLHSGQFGGAAMNAAHVLTRILGQLVAGDNGLLAAQLRAGVQPLPDDIVARIPELLTSEQYLGGEGSPPADPLVPATMYERLWSEPSLEINGISVGEPQITHMVIPCQAEAAISLRLGPGQDPELIASAVEQIIASASPDGATVTVTRRGSAPPALLPAAGLIIDIARDAFAAETGTVPLNVRAGGSLPLLGVFGDLGIPTVMTGMDLPEGNIHAPNERLWLPHLPLGTAILERILSDRRFVPVG
jgi:acetylornithine deacetylase/succinyl-diaminopimelate desuccinylase-like protein